jgi:ElaB/YqjD/DUF883 family membrane-anchored ribosome-binding protein
MLRAVPRCSIHWIHLARPRVAHNVGTFNSRPREASSDEVLFPGSEARWRSKPGNVFPAQSFRATSSAPFAFRRGPANQPARTPMRVLAKRSLEVPLQARPRLKPARTARNEGSNLFSSPELEHTMTAANLADPSRRHPSPSKLENRTEVSIKPVEEASQDFTADLVALRDDVTKLTSSVSEFIRTQTAATTSTVFDAADNARQKISDTASKAQDRVAGASTDLETTIERNPLVAVLIAMVAGHICRVAKPRAQMNALINRLISETSAPIEKMSARLFKKAVLFSCHELPVRYLNICYCYNRDRGLQHRRCLSWGGRPNTGMNEHSVLAECERGEDAAKLAY